MFTPVTCRLHLYLSPANKLSSPIEASKRFRCAIRGGLWSLSPVPGAGMLSKVDPYSEAGQGVGSGVVKLALIFPHVSPASNSWSAVRLLRSTAGCPLSKVDVGPHALFRSLESVL